MAWALLQCWDLSSLDISIIESKQSYYQQIVISTMEVHTLIRLTLKQIPDNLIVGMDYTLQNI